MELGRPLRNYCISSDNPQTQESGRGGGGTGQIYEIFRGQHGHD